MSERFFNNLSWGGNYIRTSIAYLGLGLLVLGITPDIPKAYTQTGCGGPCPEGMTCVLVGEELWECRCVPQ